MNYFRLHLGDMARDTAHLTALEFGIYSLLMQWYYANERPIPDATAHRYARSGKPETQAVLAEFFKLDGDVWRHKRIDAEITAYQIKAEFNREVGKRGGRPKKPKENPDETQPVSKVNPSHKPLANIHKEAVEQKQEHVQPAVARATPTASRFDEFWSAYPVRKGKAAALGKWKLKALDAIADTILADVAKRKTQDRDWVEGYAPHASTYVNQRGWEDDIKPINGGTNGTNRQSPKLSLADQAAQLMLERRQKRAAEAEAAIVGHGPGRALAHDG